jgi:hypothetical protein
LRIRPNLAHHKIKKPRFVVNIPVAHPSLQ